MVFVGAVTGVVSIQTSSAIWVGRLVVEALSIYKEHLEAISTLLFAYRAAMQDGGLASGLKDVIMQQNCPLVSWACLKLCSGEFHCHCCILGDSKVLGLHIIFG